MSPEEFLQMVREEALKYVLNHLGDGEDFRTLGTIPATYAAGRPTVKLDGEAVASTKTYPYLSPYVPAANDRVALLKFGHSWVVLGKVT